jgi:hypothetical protein
MKVRNLLLISILALATSPAFAQTNQTWFTVATANQQSPKLVVNLPAGATWRVGSTSNGKWSNPITTTAVTAIVDYADGLNGHPADPDPGVSKEFDVLETALPQSVTLNDTSVTPAKITTIVIPAQPGPPPPTTYTPVFMPNVVYPLTVDDVKVIAGNPAETLLQTFGIPAWQFAAGVLQNLSMTITVGGVPMVCTWGTAIKDTGTLSMACIPKPIAPQ